MDVVSRAPPSVILAASNMHRAVYLSWSLFSRGFAGKTRISKRFARTGALLESERRVKPIVTSLTAPSAKQSRTFFPRNFVCEEADNVRAVFAFYVESVVRA